MSRPPLPTADNQNRWDERWREQRGEPHTPSQWLLDTEPQWGDKPSGKAFDLACGRGSNSLYLAQRGWEIIAADHSAEAVHQASEALSGFSDCSAMQIDLCQDQPALKCSVDLLLMLNFLHRPLFPWIREQLRPGGLFIGQAFCLANAKEGAVLNPDYTLQPNELPGYFHGWEILRYREGQIFARNGASFASIIARKR